MYLVYLLEGAKLFLVFLGVTTTGEKKREDVKRYIFSVSCCRTYYHFIPSSSITYNLISFDPDDFNNMAELVWFPQV